MEESKNDFLDMFMSETSFAGGVWGPVISVDRSCFCELLPVFSGVLVHGGVWPV